MSASANEKRAAKELKNDWSQPCMGVIDSDVSSREEYSVCLLLDLSFGHDP